MRDLKELIPLVIECIEKDICFVGMCRTIRELRAATTEERFLLRCVITERAKVLGIYRNSISYWWLSGSKQPRIEFLKELLKLQE